jgi:hypothetical protein
MNTGNSFLPSLCVPNSRPETQSFLSDAEQNSALHSVHYDDHKEINGIHTNTNPSIREEIQV